MPSLQLLEVDRVEILTLMDNFFDATLASNEIARRPVPRRDAFASPTQLRAEHGFSVLVTVSREGRRDSLILDAGSTPDGVAHNLQALERVSLRKPDIPPVEAIVLSHGHCDHTAGLRSLLQRFGGDTPVHLHPDAFRRRKVVFPNGLEIDLPALDAAALTAEGVTLIASPEPSLLLGGSVLLTGEIDRASGFERGFPLQYAEIEGRWQPDPVAADDQAIAIHVRDKGLVVVTGCGHAGIVNTLRHAQSLTGVARVYAVVGGFHLGGALFEPIIEPTVAELVRLAPRAIVPAHCTGFKAIHAIASALPKAYVQNSVGTTLAF